MSDNMTQLLQLILYLGGGAGIAALALGWYTRRELRKRMEAEASQKQEEAEKLKADAVAIIENAAGNMVKQYLADNERLRSECVGLRLEVREMDSRISDAENCQSTLKYQVEVLQEEKRGLTIQVARLTEQVEALREENRRLKEERETEKQVIA